ncbi:MAG: putative thiosulfate sulfurtransferase SseB [Burkholderiaceae bacterium]|nr:putative thiosulfate sulfurtransferase SseB [Burkholderiaceae bacterium]
MLERTLISAESLLALLASAKPCVLLDCGFDLTDPAAGARAFALGHLPGAHYANLDHDLSAARNGSNGRHPLPTRQAFAATVARWGVRPGVPVVCYDNQGGSYAARAWWMLRWLGHDEVAVLDGGRGAWLAAGGQLDTAAPREPVSTAAYPLSDHTMPTVPAAALLALPGKLTVVDARSGERFRGEVEPLDPVAGRIPGARNRFHKDNLRPDGRFRSPAELRASFEVFGEPTACVHQCGSGVTACHNLLAMEHAGLTGSALYPGSWSEWCADPSRPIARG